MQEQLPKEIRFIRPDQYSWNLNNEIHVWKFPAITTDLFLLTGPEKIIADRYRYEIDKNRYVVGRQALRYLLSKYLSIEPLDIAFDNRDRKKPTISMPVSDIHFNISHSGEWVMIGIARSELGIDIEKINPEFEYDDLLEEHFNDSERSYIAGAVDPIAAFYYLWTRKEALTKAWGTGLQENLKTVGVLNEYSSADPQQNSWKLESFHFSESYHSAVAYPWDKEHIFYFDGAVLF